MHSEQNILNFDNYDENFTVHSKLGVPYSWFQVEIYFNNFREK